MQCRKRNLGAGLLFSQVADKRELEALALRGLQDHNDPKDKEPDQNERDQYPPNDGNDRQNDLDGEGRNAQEDRLPRVEADVGVLVERLDNQEDDRLNDGDVGQCASRNVGQALLCGRGRHRSE